jgi:hypothetical protein
MSGIHKLSAQVIDYAERLSDVADAAEGKRRRSAGKARWVVLPATGAALYALVRSDFFSRQAKGVARDAKTLASELPDDLMARVQQTSSASASRGNGARQSGSSRRTTSSRSRRSTKTSSSRKKSAASR